MLGQYVRALWKHWEKRLTGGSLIALAAIWALSGKTLWPKIGMGIIGATFLASGFGAWREEREKRGESALMKIDHIEGGAYEFFIHARLTNPGKKATSFAQEWTVEVEKGGKKTNLQGEMLGTIRPMQQADQFDVQIHFPYIGDISDSAALDHARFTLTGFDIRGNPVRAVYNRVRY